MADGMDFDSDESLNFWPAFTDLMLAIVLLLLLFFGAFVWLKAKDTIVIETAKKCQGLLIRSIGNQEGVTVRADEHDPLLLHIQFKDRVLFPVRESALSEPGKQVLGQVGQSIRRQLDSILEIQIHGHADTTPFPGKGNLQLASERSNRVFEYLSQDIGINPALKPMSATSYGEFQPTSRRPGETFSEERLADANSTEAKRNLNRRVELLIRYGQKSTGCPDAATGKPH